MTHFLTATTFACALATASLGATVGQDKPKDPKLGTKITITGCLHEGTAADSYVLSGMTERPAVEEMANAITPAPPMAANASAAPKPLLPIYWLEQTQGLKERVGQIIEITGEVQEKKTKTGTITVSINPADSESKEIALASGTKDVKTEKFTPAGATPPASTVVVTRQSYFLSVERVHSVMMPANGMACK